MARLVIGTSKAVKVPAVVKKVAEVPNYIAPKNNVNGVYQPDNTATTFSLNGATTVGDFALGYAFKDCSNLTSVLGFENLTSLNQSSMIYAFYGTRIDGRLDLSKIENLTADNSMVFCFARTGITSVDLSSLTTVSGSYSLNYTFSDCTLLTSADLSSLIVVNGTQAMVGCFRGAVLLTNIDISKLAYLTGNNCFGECFRGLTGLTDMTFYSLKSATGGANGLMGYCFAECTSLTSLSFPALLNLGTRTNQFSNLLNGVTGCTVHFPSNLQSVIGSWSSVVGGFSGINTTVLFDLPSTAHLIGTNSVEYERNPKYDTATALAWRVQDTGSVPNVVIDWTPFYTSGTSDPTVGTTIYSDAECQTSVTTVTAIA